MEGKRPHFFASGRHGQSIDVDPALDMVLVVTGRTSDTRSTPNSTVIQHLLSCVGDGASLPPNPVAHAELETTLQRIARPTQPDPSPTGWAANLDGRTWKFSNNALGMESLHFLPDPGDPGAKIVELELRAGHSVRYPCGMDGAYRFTPHSNADHTVSVRALKGDWVGPGRLEIESQYLDSAMYELYRLNFKGNDLVVSFADNEYFSGTIHSNPEPDGSITDLK